MTRLAEQVELLREWYPLAEFDKDRANETDNERRLRGYLYVALARIVELESARFVAPEPISGETSNESPVACPADIGEPTIGGFHSYQHLYRGSMVDAPLSFGKAKEAKDMSDGT